MLNQLRNTRKRLCLTTLSFNDDSIVTSTPRSKPLNHSKHADSRGATETSRTRKSVNRSRKQGSGSDSPSEGVSNKSTVSLSKSVNHSKQPIRKQGSGSDSASERVSNKSTASLRKSVNRSRKRGSGSDSASERISNKSTASLRKKTFGPNKSTQQVDPQLSQGKRTRKRPHASRAEEEEVQQTRSLHKSRLSAISETSSHPERDTQQQSPTKKKYFKRPLDRSAARKLSVSSIANKSVNKSKGRPKKSPVAKDEREIRVPGQAVSKWKPISKMTLDFAVSTINFNMSKVLGDTSKQNFDDVREVLNEIKSSFVEKLKKENAPNVNLGNYQQVKQSIVNANEVLSKDVDKFQMINEEMDKMNDLIDRKEEVRAQLEQELEELEHDPAHSQNAATTNNQSSVSRQQRLQCESLQATIRAMMQDD